MSKLLLISETQGDLCNVAGDTLSFTFVYVFLRLLAVVRLLAILNMILLENYFGQL